MTRIDGDLLIQLFRDAAEANKTVTYAEIEKITGRKVGGSGSRSRVYTAMAKVLEDYGYSFDCVPTVGYRPMKGIEKIAVVGKKSRQKIQSTTTKWRKNYDATDPRELSHPQLNEYIREGLKLNLQEQVAESKAQAAIEAAVEKVSPRDNPVSDANIKRMLKEALVTLAHVG